MIQKNTLMGVVLSGGRSTRMGKDKGLLQIDHQPWSKIGYEILQKYLSKVFVSINSDQYDNYKNLFHPDQIILDQEIAEGPIKGILSVSENFPNQDILVLACDMILIRLETIFFLIDAYQKNPDYDFYAYKVQGNIEPLCGIYTFNGLQKVQNQIKSNQKNFSLKKILATNQSYYIESENLDDKDFRNFNSRKDLQEYL